MIQATPSFSVSGESIVLDANGDYLITYWNGSNLMQTKLVPNTKIEPELSSVFKLSEQGKVIYRYKLTNGLGGRQEIEAIALFNVSSIISTQPIKDLPDGTEDMEAAERFMEHRNTIVNNALQTPLQWSGRVTSAAPNGILVDWEYDYKIDDNYGLLIEGLLPGHSQSGFGFKSLDLPSIAIAEIRGVGQSSEYEDEGPDPESSEIEKQIGELEATTRFVPRLAAAPMIPVPSPFDAAVTLERIQTHVHTWIEMKHLAPEFSVQLDLFFKEAIEAFRANQPRMGRPHLQNIRHLLKQAYADIENEAIADEQSSGNQGAQYKNGMISRLGARILDFNVKYVLKQLGEK